MPLSNPQRSSQFFTLFDLCGRQLMNLMWFQISSSSSGSGIVRGCIGGVVRGGEFGSKSGSLSFDFGFGDSGGEDERLD